MNAPTEQMLTAAEFLEGVELPGGWRVLKRAATAPKGTGGHFSIPYIVERTDGKCKQQAFLKALNLRMIANSPDFARDMQRHMEAFNFERDTLAVCRSKRLKRVATLLDAGEYRAPNSMLPVCYIIFELAGGGDARHQLAKLGRLELAWTLRTLHHIATALKQLHQAGIAHQDLKPSNVLFFEAFGAKVGDLGCADRQERPEQSPRGGLKVAGDLVYAPPELLYGEISADWNTRRLGCDLYLLGSMVVFFFTGGVSMTGALMGKLHPHQRPMSWRQDYRSALPYVSAAFEEALDEVGQSIASSVRPAVVEVIRQLCEPDPKRRGHSQNVDRSQFNLERFISIFDLLATKAEHKLVS